LGINERWLLVDMARCNFCHPTNSVYALETQSSDPKPDLFMIHHWTHNSKGNA